MGKQEDLFFVVRDTEVLVEIADGGVRLPSRGVVEPWAPGPTYLGIFSGRPAYAAPALEGAEIPTTLRFVSARDLFSELDEPVLHIIGVAIAAVEFETTHRFCSRCGTPTEPCHVAPASPLVVVERVRTCPRCKLTFHPRIPPAVIVLVEREGEVLLARSARFRSGMFSAVAGFVEIGESLEQAAAREVEEEVGIRIADLQYFGSQPWPFGHSLMLGFFARYGGGELRVDGSEIVEAHWFSRDRLPLLPPKISIARKLIDAYLARGDSRSD